MHLSDEASNFGGGLLHEWLSNRPAILDLEAQHFICGDTSIPRIRAS